MFLHYDGHCSLFYIKSTFTTLLLEILCSTPNPLQEIVPDKYIIYFCLQWKLLGIICELFLVGRHPSAMNNSPSSPFQVHQAATQTWQWAMSSGPRYQNLHLVTTPANQDPAMLHPSATQWPRNTAHSSRSRPLEIQCLRHM